MLHCRVLPWTCSANYDVPLFILGLPSESTANSRRWSLRTSVMSAYMALRLAQICLLVPRDTTANAMEIAPVISQGRRPENVGAPLRRWLRTGPVLGQHVRKQGPATTQPHSYTATQPTTPPHNHTPTQPATQLHNQLHRHTATQLHNQIHRYTATQLHSYTTNRTAT